MNRERERAVEAKVLFLYVVICRGVDCTSVFFFNFNFVLKSVKSSAQSLLSIRMNKSLLAHPNNQRKRKTRLALCIRVFGLVAITSFYLIASTLENRSSNDELKQGIFFSPPTNTKSILFTVIIRNCAHAGNECETAGSVSFR